MSALRGFWTSVVGAEPGGIAPAHGASTSDPPADAMSELSLGAAAEAGGAPIVNDQAEVASALPIWTQANRMASGESGGPPSSGHTKDDSEPPVRPPTTPNRTPLGPGPFPDEWKLVHFPDDHRIRITTPSGPQEMTVGEYRRRAKVAGQWVRDEAKKLLPRVANHGELYAQAAAKFGLDKHWNAAVNPYIHGMSRKPPATPPKPAGTPTTPSTPSKAPPANPPKGPAGGGNVAPPSNPTTASDSPKAPPSSSPPSVKAPPSVPFAEVSKKVSTLSKLGGKFVQGMKILTSTGVGGMLAGAGGLLAALEAIDNVQSALQGGGFIFREQVAYTKTLGSQVHALVNSYRNAGYHEDLGKMVALAREIDNQNPEALWGSDELSKWCAEAREDVAQHERDCKKLLDEMTAIDQRATAGEKLTWKLLDDPAFLLAVHLTKDDLRLWQAAQDFKKISNTVDGPIFALTGHLAVVAGDLKRIKENIIGNTFLDE